MGVIRFPEVKGKKDRIRTGTSNTEYFLASRSRQPPSPTWRSTEETVKIIGNTVEKIASYVLWADAFEVLMSGDVSLSEHIGR